jgi:hypothetical protein
MPVISTKQAGWALAALALLEAKEAHNIAGVAAITTTTEPAELIHGLIFLAGAARHGHATAAGISVAEVDEMLRVMYLLAGDGAI